MILLPPNSLLVLSKNSTIKNQIAYINKHDYPVFGFLNYSPIPTHISEKNIHVLTYDILETSTSSDLRTKLLIPCDIKVIFLERPCLKKILKFKDLNKFKIRVIMIT